MKKVILSVAIIATIGLVSCKSDSKKNITNTEQTVTKEIAMTSATFGVRGNCGMCKQTIEKAANSVEGLESAEWNGSKKEVNVSFDDTKTNLNAIHKAIANSGYDTDKIMGNLESYNNLPGCCQYDHNMEMSIKSDPKVNDHSNQDH